MSDCDAVLKKIHLGQIWKLTVVVLIYYAINTLGKAAGRFKEVVFLMSFSFKFFKINALVHIYVILYVVILFNYQLYNTLVQRNNTEA